MAKKREYKDYLIYIAIGLMLLVYVGFVTYFYKTGQVDKLRLISPKPIAPPVISRFFM